MAALPKRCTARTGLLAARLDPGLRGRARTLDVRSATLLALLEVAPHLLARLLPLRVGALEHAGGHVPAAEPEGERRGMKAKNSSKAFRSLSPHVWLVPRITSTS
jgi:hypothetical protein